MRGRAIGNNSQKLHSKSAIFHVTQSNARAARENASRARTNRPSIAHNSGLQSEKRSEQRCGRVDCLRALLVQLSPPPFTVTPSASR